MIDGAPFPVFYYGGHPYNQHVQKMIRLSGAGPRSVAVPLGHQVPIYKLHGSINWAWEPHSETLKVHDDVRAAFRQHKSGISWPVVIAVAIGQLIAAAFPGSSRSGSTIMLAMILGASRVSATEFSFLVGIPTMLAAGSLEVVDHLRKGETENWFLLFLAAVIAAVVSFIAVKWLLRYVQSHTFIGFGVYRIVFGLLLLWLLRPGS